MPPASPAATMFVYRLSNARGWRFIASASDAPASTSSRVLRMTCAKYLCSSCLPRMSRHCTSGRPASIITENCRVKMARFLVGMPRARATAGLAGAAVSRALIGSIFVTRICSRRNCAIAPSTESAWRSPLTV